MLLLNITVETRMSKTRETAAIVILLVRLMVVAVMQIPPLSSLLLQLFQRGHTCPGSAFGPSEHFIKEVSRTQPPQPAPSECVQVWKLRSELFTLQVQTRQAVPGRSAQMLKMRKAGSTL